MTEEELDAIIEELLEEIADRADAMSLEDARDLYGSLLNRCTSMREAIKSDIATRSRSMTTWAYRLRHATFRDADGEVLDESYDVIEAYFDDDDRITMWAFARPGGNTVEDVIADLMLIRDALSNPPIEDGDLPRYAGRDGGAERP